MFNFVASDGRLEEMLRIVAEHREEEDDMARRNEKHRTVKVQVGGMEAEIDEEIAPLIRELWKAGIDTLNCCQENRPGIIWVQFATAEDTAAFLDIVAEYDEEPDGLYARITGRWDGCEHSPPPWDYHALPEDLALVEADPDDDEGEEWHQGEPDFLFLMSVRFPRNDYPAVLARMVRHNEAIAETGRGDGQVKCPTEGGHQERALTVAPPAAAADAAPVPG